MTSVTSSNITAARRRTVSRTTSPTPRQSLVDTPDLPGYRGGRTFHGAPGRGVGASFAYDVPDGNWLHCLPCGHESLPRWSCTSCLSRDSDPTSVPPPGSTRVTGVVAYGPGRDPLETTESQSVRSQTVREECRSTRGRRPHILPSCSTRQCPRSGSRSDPDRTSDHPYESSVGPSLTSRA